MRIKDNTTYKQGENTKIPRIYLCEFENYKMSYSVHRHIYFPDTWLVSCKELES